MSKSKFRREFETRLSNKESRAQQNEFDNIGFADRADYWDALHRFKEVLERESCRIDSDPRCFDKPVQTKAAPGKLNRRYSMQADIAAGTLCVRQFDQCCLPTRTRRDYGYEN